MTAAVEYLNQFVSQFDEGVIILSLAPLAVVTVNNAFSKAIGYTQNTLSELNDKEIIELIHTDDIEIFKKYVNSANTQKAKEQLFIRLNGIGDKSINTQGGFILLSNKNTSSSFLYLRDISINTELKTSITKLKSMRDTVQILHNQVSWELDSELKYSFISEDCINYTGYSSNDFAGKVISELIPDFNSDSRSDLIKWMLNKRKISDLEIAFIRKDGANIRCNINGIPIFSADNEFKGYIGTYTFLIHPTVSDISNEFQRSEIIPIKIAIAELQKITYNFLLQLLKKTDEMEIVGYSSSIPDTITLMADNQVDLLLIDSRLLSYENISILQVLKKNYPNLNIILIIYNQDTIIINKCVQIGVSGFISVGTDFDNLLNCIVAVNKGGHFISKALFDDMNDSVNLVKRNEEILKKLSVRELEVLELVSKSHTNREIGEILSISLRTVESHRRNILSKFGEKNFYSLLKWLSENKEFSEITV